MAKPVVRARAATPPNKDFPDTTKEQDPVRVPRTSKRVMSLEDDEVTSEENITGEGSDDESLGAEGEGTYRGEGNEGGDEDPDVEAKQEAVAEAARGVTEAQAALDEAKENHRLAQEEHDKALKALEPKFDLAKHIYVDGGRTGSYGIVDAPLDTNNQPMLRERVVTVGGQNMEHVDDKVVYDDDGNRLGIAWCYRQM